MFHLGEESHQMKETVCSGVQIISSLALSGKGLTRWRQHEHIASQRIQFLCRQSTDVPVEVWGTREVGLIHKVSVCVDVNGRYDFKWN